MAVLNDYGVKCENRYCKRLATIKHHKDGDRSNNDPSNFRLLCSSCHRKEHVSYWDDEDHQHRSRDALDDIIRNNKNFRLNITKFVQY